MKTIEINLPGNIEKLLDKLSEDKHSFIIEAIKEKLHKLRQKNLEKELIEGYKSTANNVDAQNLLKEFDHIDLDSWDDY